MKCPKCGFNNITHPEPFPCEKCKAEVPGSQKDLFRFPSFPKLSIIPALCVADHDITDSSEREAFGPRCE